MAAVYLILSKEDEDLRESKDKKFTGMEADMLNFIWGGMILIGVLYGALNGTMAAVSEAAITAAREAVSLCITMLGVMGLWLGMMEIARASGLMGQMTKALRPVLRFLFPRIPKGHECLEDISVNLISNMLGLGWAATPAGLKAMEELAKLEAERGMPGYALVDGTVASGGMEAANGHGRGSMTDASGTTGGRKGKRERVASNEMCTFLVLNISSLQLIPVNMIAYRSQYGSVNPAGIIAPAIVATFISTLVAVVYCKGKDRRRRV